MVLELNSNGSSLVPTLTSSNWASHLTGGLGSLTKTALTKRRKTPLLGKIFEIYHENPGFFRKRPPFKILVTPLDRHATLVLFLEITLSLVISLLSSSAISMSDIEYTEQMMKVL
jgi:hypothetical protein